MFGGRQPLAAFFATRLEGAKRELNGIDGDVLLAENQDLLIASIIEKHIPRMVEADWSAMTRSAITETRTELEDPFGPSHSWVTPASKIVLTVPLSGTWELLKYVASTSTYGAIEGEVLAGRIEIQVVSRELTAEQIHGEVERVRQDVDRRAEWANADLITFQRESDQALRALLAARRARLLADRALESALTIPAHRTRDNPPLVAARRKVVSLETRRAQAAFVPEPILEQAVYEDVVTTIRSWADQLERTPTTTSKLDEEELRDLLLGTLNSYWQGQAGGELFNGHGKTDILIREGGRNAFIGECKIWGGARAASAAVDQLLSYLVWRDTKAALIVFIRNANPEATIARLNEAIEQHPSHALTKEVPRPQARTDYVLTADEESRRVLLAVLPVVIGARRV